MSATEGRTGRGVSRAEFGELDTRQQAGQEAPWLPQDLDLIRNVKVGVSAILGHREITVGELFGLQQGAVLSLEQPVDARVDVTVEGRVVARGEIVVVGDHFGIRILELPDAS